MHEEYNLTLRYTFVVPAERLFEAWVNPEQLRQWFQPGAETTARHAENDLRTGGDYRIDVQSADGSVARLSGLYHQIRRPSFLAFTWRWGDETEAEDTYVEVRFKEADGQTELLLLHDEFLTAAERERHKRMWENLLPRLAHFLSPA